jgi:hypothetical protein
MPVEEFARLYYSMSRVLEDASDSVGLSKRAAIVLWILKLTAAGALENKDLVRKFGGWHMSKTHDGASRDVSLANAELDRLNLIVIHRGPYRVELMPEGFERVGKFLEKLEEAIEKLGPEQRDMIRSLLLARKSPGREDNGAAHTGVLALNS